MSVCTKKRCSMSLAKVGISWMTKLVPPSPSCAHRTVSAYNPESRICRKAENRSGVSGPFEFELRSTVLGEAHVRGAPLAVGEAAKSKEPLGSRRNCRSCLHARFSRLLWSIRPLGPPFLPPRWRFALVFSSVVSRSRDDAERLRFDGTRCGDDDRLSRGEELEAWTTDISPSDETRGEAVTDISGECQERLDGGATRGAACTGELRMLQGIPV